MEFEIAAKTDVGKLRSKNEDAFHVDAERGLFIVADGLGGHLGGEVASRLAVEEVVSYITARERTEMNEHLLRTAVISANEKVYRRSREDLSLLGMGTTVVVAVIEKGTLWLAHVGDSRAYVLSESGLAQLTEDHTLLYETMKQGATRGERQIRHGYRGPLSRAVGVEKSVAVDTREYEYRDEGLLLCTDGLTDMLLDNEIEEVLRTDAAPHEACDSLIRMANEKGGIDNITVIVVRRGKDV